MEPVRYDRIEGGYERDEERISGFSYALPKITDHDKIIANDNTLLYKVFLYVVYATNGCTHKYGDFLTFYDDYYSVFLFGDQV